MSGKFRLSKVCAVLAASAGLVAFSSGAVGYQAVQRFNQPEQRDRSGKLLVEASQVTVVACNGANERGGQYYVYQYLNRAGFRAILPPNWSAAIGGRDWPTFDAAVGAACGGGGQPPVIGGGVSGVSGTWQLSTTCKWGPAQPWRATINLAQAPDGSITGFSAVNDPLNTEIVFPGAPSSWQSTVKSGASGNRFSLLLHPKGWLSVLEFTGTISGPRIAGRIHHYTEDDCDFTLTR